MKSLIQKLGIVFLLLIFIGTFALSVTGCSENKEEKIVIAENVDIKFVYDDEIILTKSDILSISLFDGSEPVLVFYLGREGTGKFAVFSSNHIESNVDIKLVDPAGNEEIYVCASVDVPILDGILKLAGAKDLFNLLKNGYTGWYWDQYNKHGSFPWETDEF